MKTQWTIAQLERTTATGGVTIAHWRATATDGDYSASSYGTCSFTPDADSEGFVAFEDLTESQVLEWVYASLDKEAAEASLATQIEAQKAPVTVAGMPWTQSVPE
jgi:cytochrome c1